MNNYTMMDWTDDHIRKFWDYESQHTENYFTFENGERIAKYFKKYFCQSKTILDYGCGPGFLINHLLKFNKLVAGLEFSEDSIFTINDQFSRNEYFIGGFKKDDLLKSGRKFDLIISCEVVEHLDDEKLKIMMLDIHNLLSKNGIFICTTPNSEVLQKSHIYCPNCSNVFHRWQHMRSWTLNTLQKYLQSEKFEILKMAEVNFNYTPFEIRRALHSLKYFYLRYIKHQVNPNLYAITKKI